MATNSPLGDLQARVKRSGFEAMPVGAVDIDDGVAKRGIACHDAGSDLGGFVGRVVEDLDLQLVLRIVDGADGLDKAVDDELLVEDGQLDRDPRQLFEVLGRIGVVVLAVFEIEIAERVAVHAVDRQHDHHEEVGNQQRRVKPIPVVAHRGERVAEQHLHLVAEAVLLAAGEEKGGLRRQPGDQAGDQFELGEQCRSSADGISAIVCDVRH